MTWTPTDEQVEKAARAIVEADLLDRYTDSDADDIAWDAARAVLVAVGPHIAASALRDAAVALSATGPTAPNMLRGRAFEIEKEAGR